VTIDHYRFNHLGFILMITCNEEYDVTIIQSGSAAYTMANNSILKCIAPIAIISRIFFTAPYLRSKNNKFRLSFLLCVLSIILPIITAVIYLIDIITKFNEKFSEIQDDDIIFTYFNASTIQNNNGAEQRQSF